MNDSVDHLVLYDGVCGLCDRFVRFLLAHDRRGILRFAPLQGSTAAALRGRIPSLPRDIDSIIYVRYGREFTVRSRAVFDILSQLDGRPRWLAALRVISRPLCDWAYDRIAANRYRRFGKFDTCPLPDPSVRERFLP